MYVKSAPGSRCPMEQNPREYISDTEASDIPDTTYYRRLVDDGSLIETAKPKTPKGGDQ